MASKGLSHVALKVRDLKTTEKFYTEILGLKVAFRVPPNMLFLSTPGSSDLLNFVKTGGKLSGNQGLEHIGFHVTADRLKKLEKKLASMGVTIDGRRGRSAFYISDPDGYQLEYYCD
jgi:catechol 2,3-dioxygenase-like lactoylglutathione lyase family enzyme